GTCGCPLPTPCTGTSFHFDSTDVPKAISSSGTPVVTSTIVVSGLPTYLLDLNAKTFITHTFCGDIDMTLTSPSGTSVTLTSDLGSLNDNVFNGTVWDDQADPVNQVPFASATFAASRMVSDHTHVNLTTSTPLTPLEAFGAFIGENPNG